MADVQRAYDEQLDREVAVKILHARYRRRCGWRSPTSQCRSSRET
jgi:hypothetical protein